MYGIRKSEPKNADGDMGMGNSMLGNSADHGCFFDSLGHLLPNDDSINPAQVYAITGEQLIQALQTAIAKGQSQNPCKQCERRSVRPPNIPVPSFNGHPEEMGAAAKNFLRKLECYVASQRYTYAEALEMVVPCALDGPAGLWWESEGAKFKNWHDFLGRFKKEFGVTEYVDKYRQLVETRTQNPEEPLLDFIHLIHSNYREFAPRAADQDIIGCILKQAHPECRILLKQKSYASVDELKDVAKEVDETLTEMRQYRKSATDGKMAPPPVTARTPSPVPTKETPPDLTPTKESSTAKAWKTQVNPVSPNYRCEDKDVFLPPWAEKEQPRKTFSTNPPKTSFGGHKTSFSKFQKMYPRSKLQTPGSEPNTFRCYACGMTGHAAHSCRNKNRLYKAFDRDWDDE